MITINLNRLQYEKAVIIFTVACVVGVMGTCIYFVAGVSGTGDPIKTYDSSGNVDTLVRRLNELVRVNKSLTYKPTDTTGTEETGHDYYFQLHWITTHSDTIQYTINLSRTNYRFSKNKTVIELVEAINLTDLSGGYSQSAKGVQPLINMFDTNILPHITQANHSR